MSRAGLADFRLHPADPRDLRAGGLRPYREARDPAGRGCAAIDDELDDFIREHVESAYHPCGTCRMGAADDPMAVVDPDAG
jgi:choline dehydrogenase-like flavoprotein